MQSSFPDNYEKIANDMGIALYQRFSLNEAALFLRCPEKEIEKLVYKYELNYIRVTKTEIQFSNGSFPHDHMANGKSGYISKASEPWRGEYWVAMEWD